MCVCSLVEGYHFEVDTFLAIQSMPSCKTAMFNSCTAKQGSLCFTYLYPLSPEGTARLDLPTAVSDGCQLKFLSNLLKNKIMA